jgi:multidrug efflux pump subunit AcrA (membrane-fusion protein)
VFEMMSDNTVKRYDVEVTREDENNAQIKTSDGLKPGDMVVTAGRQNLEDGSKVKVEKSK